MPRPLGGADLVFGFAFPLFLTYPQPHPPIPDAKQLATVFWATDLDEKGSVGF